jgi:GT2 family glycosyltransferase
MVAFNHLDLTKKAIQSLFECTDKEHYKLVFINNGSFDDTCNWAYQNLDKYCSDFKIRNRNNDGWIKAINEEITNIDTPYFVTCHNDIIFEKDWLPKMVNQFQQYDKIAMVGPTSDFILGLQNKDYNMFGIPSEYTKFICGLFCMFNKSAVDELIAKDGFFMDPIFGMGDKEELDYAIRLSNLGYNFCIARSVFIHHDGEKGFVDKLGSREAFHKYQDDKLAILVNKWGKEKVDALYKCDLSKRVHVLIATPLRNNYMHYRFAASLLTMQKVPAVQYMNTVRYVIAEARNLLVEYALKQNCSHVLFIDDDMIIPNDALVKLLEHDVDIVCGLAFRRLAPYDPCVFVNVDKDIFPIEHIDKGLVEIDACGSAFVLIRTNVFNKMPKPWYVWGDKSLGIYENAGGLGEDVSFSLKAKRMGFRVCCDTSVILGHIGEENIIDHNTYLNHKATLSENEKLGVTV